MEFIIHQEPRIGHRVVAWNQSHQNSWRLVGLDGVGFAHVCRRAWLRVGADRGEPAEEEDREKRMMMKMIRKFEVGNLGLG